MRRVSYFGEGNEGQRGHCSKHDSWDQHDQCNQYIIAEEGNGGQPSAEKDRGNFQLILKYTQHEQKLAVIGLSAFRHHGTAA